MRLKCKTWKKKIKYLNNENHKNSTKIRGLEEKNEGGKPDRLINISVFLYTQL